MSFHLETMTKCKVLDVRTLAAKDRKPDEPPGAQLLIQSTLPAATLALFDGFLPGMLYRKSSGAGSQGSLDGMHGDELTTIGEHVKRLPWSYEQTGCTVEIDRGLGGSSNIVLDDCKVHRVSFQPQQGGGVKVQWSVDAPALSDDVRGKLTGLKATEIEMQLALPEVAQDELDDTEHDASQPKAARRTKRAPKDSDPTGAVGSWPFPKNDTAAANSDDPVLAAAQKAHGVQGAA